MDTVVADLEGGYTGVGFFTLFHGQQKFAGIGIEGAELIQFLIIAISDNTAIANNHGRVFFDGAGQ